MAPTAADQLQAPLLRVSALLRKAMVMACGALHGRGLRDQLLAETHALKEKLRGSETVADVFRERVLAADPSKRPHYPVAARMRILRHIRRFGLTLERASRLFAVDERTIRRWFEAVDDAEAGADAPAAGGHRLPEITRVVTRQLIDEEIDYGSRKIAGLLARLGLKGSRTSVQRIGRESLQTPRKRPKAKKPVGRPLKAKRANHYWQTDFTKVGVFGFTLFHAMAVMDLYSRKVLAFELWRRAPTAGRALAVLQRAVAAFGRPDYLITDQGTQFTAAEFTGFLRRRRMGHRLGAVGSSLSIAVLERFWRTFKEECGDLSMLLMTREAAHRRAERYVDWYDRHRPHWSLKGRTPNDVYYRRRRRRRNRKDGVLEVRYLDGDRSLPIYRLRKAA